MAQQHIDEFDLVVHVVARSVGTGPLTEEQAVAAFNQPDTSPVYHRAAGVEYEVTSAMPLRDAMPTAG